MYAVAKRPTCQSRQLALVTVCERDHNSVGCKVLESGQRVRSKTGFGLFAICQDWGPGLFEAIHGVPQCLGVRLVQHIASNFVRLKGRDRLNKLRRTGDAANRFSRNHVRIIYRTRVMDLNLKDDFDPPQRPEL
jgi:hypothetical protein